jgi:hypothetical protein
MRRQTIRVGISGRRFTYRQARERRNCAQKSRHLVFHRTCTLSSRYFITGDKKRYRSPVADPSDIRLHRHSGDDRPRLPVNYEVRPLGSHVDFVDVPRVEAALVESRAGSALCEPAPERVSVSPRSGVLILRILTDPEQTSIERPVPLKWKGVDLHLHRLPHPQITDVLVEYRFPGALAPMEILPIVAQMISATTRAMMLQSTQRLSGDGGVSSLSNNGGSNSRCCGVNSRPFRDFTSAVWEFLRDRLAARRA